MIDTANSELTALTQWFQANRLTVNLAKSNFIVFCCPKLKYDRTLSTVKINNYALRQVESAKFLGVYIDEHLNWKKTHSVNFTENF